jgi:hypothetical protein
VGSVGAVGSVPRRARAFAGKSARKKNLKLGSRVRAGWTWSGWLAPLLSFFAMDYVRYMYGAIRIMENARQLGLHSRTLDMFLMLDVVLLRSRIISGRYKTSHHPPPASIVTNKQTRNKTTCHYCQEPPPRACIRKQTERSRTLSGTCRLSVMVSDTTTSQGSSQENVTMPTCMAQIRALRYEQTPIIIIISIIIIIIQG